MRSDSRRLYSMNNSELNMKLPRSLLRVVFPMFSTVMGSSRTWGGAGLSHAPLRQITASKNLGKRHLALTGCRPIYRYHFLLSLLVIYYLAGTMADDNEDAEMKRARSRERQLGNGCLIFYAFY